MRRSPGISEDELAACLRDHYDVAAAEVRHLPIGYDLDAYVYEVTASDYASYFVKIRKGAASLPGVFIPSILAEHGIPNIMAPLQTRAQELWCRSGPYSVVVFPFIRGSNAVISGLSDSQWREFGAALQAIHFGGFASLFDGHVPAETFSIPSAQVVRDMSARIDRGEYRSQEAKRAASFLADNALLIERMIVRAEALGKQLQTRRFENVLCHADIHAANIMVGEDCLIYLVDWDNPLIAPRERDLLFIVGSKIARSVLPREEALFFEGYGAVDVDMSVIAYYRYERILEDVGEIGRSLLGDADRSEEEKAEETELLISLFEPNNIVQATLDADQGCLDVRPV